VKHVAGYLSALLPISLSWNAHAATDTLAGLRQLYDGTMLPGVEVATFSHSEKLQPVRVVHRGKSSIALAKRAKPFPAIRFDSRAHHYDMYDYLANNRVAGTKSLAEWFQMCRRIEEKSRLAESGRA
jgi:hypothetical protein